ncbi:MAG: 4a-hydroxytetrahydrobiopterin dehydratase, partial [Pseudomonadota bacterium]
MAQKIYISYRRKDTALFAMALKTELETRLSGCSVFVDLQSIEQSSLWEAVIERNLREANVMISLIGPNWLGSDEKSVPRIKSKNDWVRRELSFALKNMEGAIYPMICGDCKLPSANQLPRDLQDILRIQTGRLSVDRWTTDIQTLIQSLISAHGFSERTYTFNYPKHDSFKMMAPAVTRERLDTALSMGELHGWQVDGSDDPRSPNQMWIVKKFGFNSFQDVMGFMNSIGALCEALDHHPRWENVFDELLVRLST